MAESIYTDEDRELLRWQPAVVECFRHSIGEGRPYVWALRLTLADFLDLEKAVKESVESHGGSHKHLLTEAFAPTVVIYLAEWYKRYYNGNDTMDENKMLSLNSTELQTLYDKAGIDKQTFVYNASKNPDKTSLRWLESLQVLGGLAVRAELKRDKTDALLPQLCRMFHGEDIELEDIRDHGRAVAFQESITRRQSLYEYLSCILDKAKTPPFALEDMKDDATMIPELISRIEDADRLARRNKFDFEWIIAYSNRGGDSHGTMVRHLKVRMKPEVRDDDEEKSRRLYLGYDRLRQPEWGIEHPEEVGRIEFYLRFKNGSTEVKAEGGRRMPIFEYHNTGSEKTGFHSVNMDDWNVCTNVPAERFDKVELVMKYDDKTKTVQDPLLVADYMQVYAMPKSGNKFSSRKNSQAMTAVIFSTAYHLTEPYKDIPVAYARFRNGERESEDYCWCPINDKVVIADENGREVLPPFFNRNGLYQVVTKKYLKTIKYRDNVFVLYKYIDIDEDEDGEEQTEERPVLFGRSGLQVLHYDTGKATTGMPVTDYDLEWKRNSSSRSRYVNWNEAEPEQGEIWIRVTVGGVVFKMAVYYVPFVPINAEQQPIWRDFTRQKICTALKGVNDVQDHFDMKVEKKEADTIQLEIGNKNSKILVDVYRPVIVRELSQNGRVISYSGKGEEIGIPLINCNQFSLRDFSEDGVKEYRIASHNTVYYKFPTINEPNIDPKKAFTDSRPVAELIAGIPLDYLKIYIVRLQDESQDLYAWDYKSEPRSVGSEHEMQEVGIVFQSMKDNDSPRHYRCPAVTSDDDDWGDDWGDNDEEAATDKLACFETIAEHRVYFFLFKPMLEVVHTGRQITEILLPLLRKREMQLTADDLRNLYRFALEFHFDWMLLPRDRWTDAINEFTNEEKERDQLKEAILLFFGNTPKCADEREETCLREFIAKYWTFTAWPNGLEPMAQSALKLILGDPEALGRINDMKDFLSIYDECRYKFSEMSRISTK